MLVDDLKLIGGAQLTNFPYDIGTAVIGRPAANAVILRFLTARPFEIRADADVGQAKAAIGATNNTTLTVAKNGVPIGTFIFVSGTNVASADVDTTVFEVGDSLTITMPSAQDPTLSDIQVTLLGYSI
jgi:hypothetical protein